MTQPATVAAVTARLHPTRFATYLDAASGDPTLALQLYRWNLRLAAAFHTSLSLLEVVLRNAMDEQLRTWNGRQPKLGGGTHQREWLLDPGRPLNTITASARSTATTNAGRARAARPATHPRKTAPISHDDVLAQLTFGTFSRLLPTRDPADQNFVGRNVLWQQALIHAFPHVSDPDGRVTASRVHRLQHLRNRVAHLEPLLDVHVAARFHDMTRLVGSIDTDVRGWFGGTASVREVARERPS